MFSAETEARFKHLRFDLSAERSALIPMLLLAQREQGYITSQAMEYIARVSGVVGFRRRIHLAFYTLLRRKPAGKYHILICTNLACMLRGSDDIEACVKNASWAWNWERSRPTASSPRSNSNAWARAPRRP